MGGLCEEIWREWEGRGEQEQVMGVEAVGGDASKTGSVSEGEGKQESKCQTRPGIQEQRGEQQDIEQKSSIEQKPLTASTSWQSFVFV